MQEISYKDMKFNPFNLIGGEWMLITAGDEHSCNTMTASWGHLGCLWGNNDPSAVVYIRESRYTKEFVDEEPYFSLCVMDKSFKKQMAYLGSTSGRDEDKIRGQDSQGWTHTCLCRQHRLFRGSQASVRLQEGVCRRNPAKWHHLSGNHRQELSAGRLSHHVRGQDREGAGEG